MQASETAVGGGQHVSLQDMMGASGTMVKSDLKLRMDALAQKQLTVAVPVPRRQRDQIERKVAYEAAAKEVSKWVCRAVAGWAVCESGRTTLCAPTRRPSTLPSR